MRDQAELANAVAEQARATAEAARLEEEKVEALQAEVQFAISTMEEMKAGLTSAGQAALVARREAEQAKKAAEHAGDGTGEHVTQVFREILGLAAKGRPRTLQPSMDTTPPEPREPRHGFDDETSPDGRDRHRRQVQGAQSVILSPRGVPGTRVREGGVAVSARPPVLRRAAGAVLAS